MLGKHELQLILKSSISTGKFYLCLSLKEEFFIRYERKTAGDYNRPDNSNIGAVRE